MRHFKDCKKGSCRCELKRYLMVLSITLVIFVLEIFGSQLSKSLALYSDAWHVLIDFWAVLLAVVTEYCVVRFKRFPDAKLRSCSGILSSMLLVAVIVIIIFEAVGRLQAGTVISTGPLMIIATVGLMGNACAVLLLHSGASHITRRALFRHVLSDTLQSAVVVATGLAIYLTGIYLLDPVVSIAIALVMSIWVYKTIQESIQELRS